MWSNMRCRRHSLERFSQDELQFTTNTATNFLIYSVEKLEVNTESIAQTEMNVV